MVKKKKMHPVLKILWGLFIVYIALFIANISGYYEGRVRSKVELTNEKIMEFENLVQNGEEIDMDSFLQMEREDYSNKVSNLGEKITVGLQDFVKNGMYIVGNVFKSLF